METSARRGWLEDDRHKMEAQVLFDRHDKQLVADTDLQCDLVDNPEAPVLAVGSSKLSDDVSALTSILKSVTVPGVVLRSKRIESVVYGFGDASGTGLGATFVGVWGT